MIADLRLAETLRELIDTCQSLWIMKGKDGLYCGNLGNISRCTSGTLEGCIDGLTPNPRKKTCIRDGCLHAGQPIVISLFGPDKDSADGHASVCHACESKRVSEHNRKKKQLLSLAASHQDKVSETSG